MSLSRFVESLSTARQWALGSGIVLLVATLASGGPASAIERLLHHGIAITVLGLTVGSFFVAAITVEMLRATSRKAYGWSDETHFTCVLLMWLLLAVAALGLVLLLV
jgi:hypothetical protein